MAAGKDDGPLAITELARQLGITARAIRFYEDRGLVAPARNGTTRVYSHRDRARLILVLRGKRLGFSLREIKEYLDLYDSTPTHIEQIRRLRDGVRHRILMLEEQRRALDETLGELRDIERQADETLTNLALTNLT
jgi:DNA-binding transcriptional MerR regulator